jgi:hypothetical protein
MTRVTLKPGEKATPAYWVAKAAERVQDAAASIRRGKWGTVPGDREAAAAAADAIAAYAATMPPTPEGQRAAEWIAATVPTVLTGEAPQEEAEGEEYGSQ